MELVTRSELRWSLVRAMAVITTVVVLFATIAGKIGPLDRDAWFMSLAKPADMPSPAAFTLIWSVMFLFLGLSIALVWQARGAVGRFSALTLLLLTFALGLSWSPITFGFKQLYYGVLISGATLLLGLLAMTVSFKIRKTAGFLSLFFVAWLLYCAYTSVMLWRMNQSTAHINMAGQDMPLLQH